VVLVRPDLLRVLGRGLKKLYAPVVQEEVPNHLAQLVEELDLPKGEPPRRS
jgi:hypothetical protein